MNRPILHAALVVMALACSAALAQTGPAVQVPPLSTESSPGVMTAFPSPPPPGEPAFQPTTPSAPAGQATWPPPAQPILQAAPPPAPPPVVQTYPPAAPWVVAPAQPIWGPEPSPGLGLIPGDSATRWDISFEALWLARDAGTGVRLGATDYNFDSHAFQAIPTQRLWSDDALFPLEPGIRFQLIGRITDQMAIEASAWGLQQWSVGRTIYGDPDRGSVLAYSPWLQTSDRMHGFDNFLGYTDSSEVANAEINQRFKFLSFDPYRALSWMWGVRYFFLSDDFALTGSDLYNAEQETLTWRTKNNLIGMQLGLQWTWGWERFQLSTEFKAGLFANVYTQQGTDSASGPVAFQPVDVSHSGTDLAALFELSILARYRLTNCLWVRAGYQYNCVTGLALGPRQLGGFDAGGTVQLDGLSIGLELTR